ncbi:hypothetical protein BDK51DRAFT_29162 [Blyttiomyces helicus]|uniref:Uncharacterized protein n=1 Tax=Blyttiomyces helicus TaxID=388810 RepID=A0A4P9WIS3_9FUNG|nr:hypothetical protein BDK51DRAFT_29162 [Blyttiomyces helicus]|eukprot:RKO91348.1 hypothetical protein BDK51DRAFT_29162 [Blyttiomyces helicus]
MMQTLQAEEVANVEGGKVGGGVGFLALNEVYHICGTAGDPSDMVETVRQKQHLGMVHGNLGPWPFRDGEQFEEPGRRGGKCVGAWARNATADAVASLALYTIAPLAVRVDGGVVAVQKTVTGAFTISSRKSTGAVTVNWKATGAVPIVVREFSEGPISNRRFNEYDKGHLPHHSTSVSTIKPTLLPTVTQMPSLSHVKSIKTATAVANNVKKLNVISVRPAALIVVGCTEWRGEVGIGLNQASFNCLD